MRARVTNRFNRLTVPSAIARLGGMARGRGPQENAASAETAEPDEGGGQTEPESVAEDAGDAPDDPIESVSVEPPEDADTGGFASATQPEVLGAFAAPNKRRRGRAKDDELVVDVGPTTLPTLPTRATSSSVPAVRSRQSALDAFLAGMGKYPVLSTEEERELTMAYYEHKDSTAGRKLVVHNLRLVVKMAYRYRRAWASVMDLIQEGNIGLVEAVQRFDPFKGAKFSTYATFWIRAYMLRYLLENSRTVRVSRTRVGRKLFFQLARERAKLRAMGIEPEPKLLAERLGVDSDELEDMLKYVDQQEVRVDAPIGEDGSTGTILDTMRSQGRSPEAEAAKAEFASSVTEALDAFAETLTDERELMAWSKHLMADDPMSLSQLGAHFGVTKQRMGQIVTAIKKRLRKHLVTVFGPDVELGFYFDEV